MEANKSFLGHASNMRLVGCKIISSSVNKTGNNSIFTKDDSFAKLPYYQTKQ